MAAAGGVTADYAYGVALDTYLADREGFRAHVMSLMKEEGEGGEKIQQEEEEEAVVFQEQEEEEEGEEEEVGTHPSSPSPFHSSHPPTHPPTPSRKKKNPTWSPC